jgi:hypothetical protein
MTNATIPFSGASVPLANIKRKLYPSSVVRRCKVSVADIEGVEHSTEVSAASLYEAIAAALTCLRKDDWVGEIGRGLTTVKVEVQQPPVTHEVRMKDF